MATFAVPDNAHRPATYWFWYDVPSRSEIETQVAQIKAGGFGSFQVQARLGFPREEFLGEAYLDAVAVAVDEAARLGLTVGIYDDYCWQSGHAGGRTVAGHDHLREEHVFWSVAEGEPGMSLTLAVDDIVSPTESLGPAAMRWQYDGGVCRWAGWTVVAVLAVPVGDRSGRPAHDLTEAAVVQHADEGSCTVVVPVPDELAGTHRLTAFVRARATTSRLPSYLLPEAAERFVEVAYEPYARVLGDHLGSTVEYVFFDQPHATFWTWAQLEGLRCSLPWSEQLPVRYEATHGLDARQALLALVHDVGPQTARLRTTWYQTYSQLAQESFLGVLADWCHRHGLALSGHEVLGHVGSWHPTAAFGAWDLRMNFGVDHFGVDAFRDRTAVDAQDCVPQLSAKLGDSVARANGRSGCIVEQYLLGSLVDSYPGDWDVTLTDIRAQALRLHLAGARQFLFHAFSGSDGTSANTDFFVNPRFDFAPGVNFEPWWGFHAAFADESARLSTFLDACEPLCEVAVLWPLRTRWAEGGDHNHGDHVAFWAEHLAREGLGHHFVDERDLLAATVSDGSLRIGTRGYACVVLPSVTTLRSVSTVEVLRRFAEAGGLLVVSGDAPRSDQEGPPGGVAVAWEQLAGLAAVRRVEPASAPGLLDHLRSDRPWLQVDGPGVWQWAGTPSDRREDHAWRLVAFNDTDDDRLATLVTPWPGADVCRWDAADGRVGDWVDGSSLRLGPMELVCLAVRPAAATPSRPGPGSPEAVVEVVLDGGWTLTLPRDGGGSRSAVPVDPSRGWEEQGFAAYSGLGVYRRTLDIPEDAGLGWSLVLPAVHTAAEAVLDGRSLGRRGWPPYVFALPDPEPGPHRLEVLVHNTAGNAYLQGTPFERPAPSGLTAVPTLWGIMASTTTDPGGA